MEFLVPKLSATMETAKVLAWLKREGESVKAGEPLVELETDKAALEIESPIDAVLGAIAAPEGASIPVGALLARLDTGGAVSPRPRILASPAARRLAGLHGVALASLAGSGPHGRIRARDVLAAAPRPSPAAAPVAAPPVAAPPVPAGMSAMRARVAATVSESRRTIPAFSLDRWVETTALAAAREALRPRVELASGVVRITTTDLLLVAMADALTSHMALLDRWIEQPGGPARIASRAIDIGLVVAVGEGMMIPVLHDLAGRSLADVARSRRDAVQRARSGRLLATDSETPPITLSNLGRSGADRFEAIIAPGASAILAVGREAERVIARGGGIAVASGVTLTLSVDHRLIDGLRGAGYLGTLAERIEFGPWTLA